MGKTTVDPELARQLNAAQESGAVSFAVPAPVQAVIYLHPEPGELAVPADQIQGVVDGLLDRVTKAVGTAPERHNTFRNLGSFAIQAAPEFLRELCRQPEVASAVANRRH